MINPILLRSKFLLPLLEQNHLPRPHLIQQMQSNLSSKHLTLIAPAGYGKTSLLAEFALEATTPVMWLQLNESDNDASTFMAYLIESICQKNHDLSTSFHAHLNLSDLQTDQTLIVLINEFLGNPELYGVLILEDYHVIDNPIIHDYVVNLMENLPIRFRVILSSRRVPDLPLALWRSRQQVAEMRMEQLRFSHEEVNIWLTQQLVDANSIWSNLLYNKTEGWCAGLQLFFALFNETITQDRDGVIQQFSGSHPYIFDYFMSEVFNHQAHDIQEFFLTSSILVEIQPDVCLAVLKVENSGHILARIQKENLFIELDYEHELYRYHPLFRDFLLEKFRQDDAIQYRTIQSRAARYYAGRGDYERAILHDIQAGDMDNALAMFNKFASIYLNQGRFDELTGYLSLFENITHHLAPELLLIRGRILHQMGNYPLAIETINEAQHQLKNEQSDTLCAVLVELANIKYSQGYYQQGYELAQSASLIGETHDSSHYILALMQMAQCAGFIDGMDLGRKLAEDAISQMHQRSHLLTAYQKAHLLGSLAQICWWHGDVQMVISHCQDALSYLDENESPLRAHLLILLATPLLYQQAYGLALNHVETALAICQNLQLKSILPSAYSTLGNVLTRLGELDRAETCFRKGIAIGREIGGASYTQVMAVSFLAQNLALQGRSNEARQIAESALSIAEGEPLRYEYYVCQSVLADLLLDSRQLNEARTIYEMLVKQGQQRQYRIPLGMAYFGLAYIHLLEERRQQASEYSRVSLQLLESGMVQQLYLDQRERAILVCRELLNEVPPSDFVKQVYDTLLSTLPNTPIISIQADQSPRIYVQTLGQFRVFRDNVEIDAKSWQSAKARDALAYFITHRNKSIPLDRIICSIWSDDAGSTTAFHTALYRLRKALRDDKEKTKFILSEVGEYRLDISRFLVDVDQFDALFKQAQTVDDTRAMHLYETALNLYQDEYLENLYYEWALSERERLERQYVHILYHLSVLKQFANDFLTSIALIEKAIDVDPYQEALYCHLMRLYSQLGDRNAIQKLYGKLCEILDANLKLIPQIETQNLYQNLVQILSH